MNTFLLMVSDLKSTVAWALWMQWRKVEVHKLDILGRSEYVHMPACVCLCVCVYIYASGCLCVCVCVSICMCASVSAGMFMQVCVCVCVCVFMCIPLFHYHESHLYEMLLT